MAEKFEYTREWTDAEAFPLLGFTKSWKNPEDYPTIELDEEKVREDMQSLHDEVKNYINTKLIPAILADDATEEARASAEAARETAEQARATAEEERAAAEQARVEAENGRVSAESARVTAEQERAAAEQARADENTGIVAQATAQADAAEAAKKSAESAATSALSYKSAAYSSSVLAGQERGAAEQAKINAEAAQGKAEAAKDAAIASETAAKASETAAAASAKAAADSAARAEEVVGGGFATTTELSAHTGNAGIHVTAEEKAAWDGKAEKAKYVSVTLPASGWDSTAKTQTVTVTGVSATETAQLITPVPALASQAAYYDAGIKCTGQAANSLTFTADTIPTVDLTVYVTIQEVSA